MVKVNICVVTYNHRKYIRQTLDSILMQKTNFPFEIVIGEDCSTDDTRGIVLEYKKKYPGKIKLLLQKQNVGATRNFIETLKLCSGQYIAICDGDDYWVDPNKLQKQVDFLETHNDYAICFHNSQIIDEQNRIRGLYCEFNKDRTFTIKDILKRNFIPTASVVFRNYLNNDFLDKLLQLKAADWAFHIYNAEKGKIYYMNEIMARWRVHSEGIWAKLSHKEGIRFKLNSILDVNKIFDYKYDNELRQSLYEIYINKPCGYKDVFRYYKRKFRKLLKL